jgi:zinc protease
MLREFHKNWYAPNNMILVIVGDVNPVVTLARIKELFGRVPNTQLMREATRLLQEFSN